MKNRAGTGGVISIPPSPDKRWVREFGAVDAATGEPHVALPIPDAFVAYFAAAIRLAHGSPPCARPPPYPASRDLVHPVTAPNLGTTPDAVSATPALDRAARMLHLLSKTRWDDRTMWRDIATALKNDFGEALKSEWMRLSRTSYKFNLSEAEKLWASVEDPDFQGRRLTCATIDRWASEDDPVGFDALSCLTLPDSVLDLFATRGDAGLAKIAYSELKNVIKRTPGPEKDNNYYLFIESECAWEKVCLGRLRIVISDTLERVMAAVTTHYDIKASVEADPAKRRTLLELKAKAAKTREFVCSSPGINRVMNIKAFELKLDHHRHLLGVRNGVVDLRTGTLRARVPDDYIYKIVNVDYERADTSLMHDAVLASMVDDEAMVTFLQKLLGYTITGEVSEEIFIVFTGSGRCAHRKRSSVCAGLYSVSPLTVSSRRLPHTPFAQERQGRHIRRDAGNAGGILRGDERGADHDGPQGRQRIGRDRQADGRPHRLLQGPECGREAAHEPSAAAVRRRCDRRDAQVQGPDDHNPVPHVHPGDQPHAGARRRDPGHSGAPAVRALPGQLRRARARRGPDAVQATDRQQPEGAHVR